MELPVHPEVAPLAALLGVWRGEGYGDYPTIEGFEYTEESTFAHVGKPFLSYTQRTKRAGEHPEAGLPLHSEFGFLRPAGPGKIELLVVQPSGFTEVQQGTFDGKEMRLEMTSLGASSTAKHVDRIERKIWLENDTLRYEIWLTAVGEPHQWHLSATLRRS